MDTALVVTLTNFGAAGVTIILIILGWLVPKWVYVKLEKENKHLKEALDLERQARREAVGQGAVTTNQLIGALVSLAEKNQSAGQLTRKDP